MAAIRGAAAAGASVLAFDHDAQRLRYVVENTVGVEAAKAGERAIAEALTGADVVIGAILVAGTRSRCRRHRRRVQCRWPTAST